MHIGHTSLGGKIGNNFKVDDIVQVARTSDKELDGQFVIILGEFGDDPRCAFYIIQLERKLQNGSRAIVLIESCLDRTSPNER